MKIKIITIFLLLLFSVWGCGGYVYKKPDKVDLQKWVKDVDECWYLAFERALEKVGSQTNPKYGETFKSYFGPCMENHGYSKSWTWGKVK